MAFDAKPDGQVLTVQTIRLEGWKAQVEAADGGPRRPLEEDWGAGAPMAMAVHAGAGQMAGNPQPMEAWVRVVSSGSEGEELPEELRLTTDA